MTKYEDLSKLAVAHASARMDDLRNAESTAELVRSRVARQLEAPDDTVQFASLDEQLEPTATAAATPSPIRGKDGRWYFGLLLHFALSGGGNRSKAAVQLSTVFDGSTLKVFLHRTEYVFRKDQEADWSRFLGDLEETLRAYYSSGWSAPRASVGFVSFP